MILDRPQNKIAPEGEDADYTEHKIHVLPITPELKRAALTKGFPMFAAGGLATGLSSGSNTASEPPPNTNEQMLQALRGGM
jgi:hypothetical protein